MVKSKEPDWEHLWASQIYRTQRGGKEYIFAHVRKKYGERDVESIGPGDYIGIQPTIQYEMSLDTDPESETFNKRVPKEITVYDASGREIKQKVQKNIDWSTTHEATPEVLEKYRKLVGDMPDPHGTTQFYWRFGRNEKYQAYDADEFFNTPLDVVRDNLIRKKLVLDKKKKGKKDDQNEESE